MLWKLLRMFSLGVGVFVCGSGFLLYNQSHAAYAAVVLLAFSACVYIFRDVFSAD